MTEAKLPRSKRWSWFTAELKRRGVYPVVAAYAFVAFVALEVGGNTIEPLGLPNWVMIGLIVLIVLGFPVAAAAAWTFDITARGIRRDAGQSAEAGTDAEHPPSIAVLPFVDMSRDKDQRHFCEGVAEEILNALTKIGQLRVAARSSSFRYDAGAGDVREIGRQLGVDTLLEGSVRKSGDRLRVTAQLVKTSDGYHLWSKSFDAEREDVFAIQDEIAKSIAEALLETLTPGQHSKLKTTSSKHVDAYEFYLRGRYFFRRFRKADIEYALQMFRQAIDVDPEFAAAWAGCADCHSFLVMYAETKPGYRDNARDASSKAVELDPDLAEAHAARGLAHLVCEEFDAAEAAFKRAIALNPQLFEAYYYFARTRFHQGLLEEANELFRKAAEVDPTDYQSRCLRVQILRGMERIDQAREEATAAIEVLENHLRWNPDDARAYQLGAGTLIILGRIEQARQWLERVIGMHPDDPIVLYNVACILATLGEADRALDYLEQAAEYGTVSAAWMRNDEDLAKLRGDPRYTALLARLEQRAGDESRSGLGAV